MRRRALLVLAALLASACTITSSVPPSSTTTATPKKRTIDAVGLRDSFQKRAGYTYKVSYAINGTFDKQAIGGRLVAYQVPPRRRIDTTLGNGRDSQSFTLYIDDTSIVACALPFAPPCEPITPDEAATAGLGLALLDAPILESPQALDRAEISEDRIAGQAVSCFLLKQPGAAKLQAGAELNACYTAEGILMRYGITTPQFNVELDGVLLLRDFPVDDVKLPQNAFLR
jgi:hypothetical protein